MLGGSKDAADSNFRQFFNNNFSLYIDSFVSSNIFASHNIVFGNYMNSNISLGYHNQHECFL